MARKGRPPRNALRRIVTGLDVNTGQTVSWCDGSLSAGVDSESLIAQVRWTSLMQVPYEVMPDLFVRPSLDSSIEVTAAMLAASADIRIVEPMPDEVRSLLEQGVVADV